jgi:hypothetical protein
MGVSEATQPGGPCARRAYVHLPCPGRTRRHRRRRRDRLDRPDAGPHRFHRATPDLLELRHDGEDQADDAPPSGGPALLRSPDGHGVASAPLALPRRRLPGGSWTEVDERIVIGNRGMTDRAARWACEQVGRHGRSVAEVADELGCDCHTVNRAVIGYGLALVDDPERIGPVTTLGLDETAFVRLGPYKHRLWSTQIVGDGQLLDVVAGRDAAPACEWLAGRPQAWRNAIEWVTLDLAGSYRAVADTMLPHATQVADPFHVVRAANERLDEVRRRVQNETLGHRGRKADPLYRTRRLLVMADERLDARARERRRGLLAAGDPRGESPKPGWRRKPSARSTGSVTPTSRSSRSPSSPPRSTTGSTATRSDGSDACSPGGHPRSRPGTDHAPATAPSRPSTASPSASRGSRSASRTGPTGGFGCCSTPAVPTGRSSPPSPRPPRELPKSHQRKRGDQERGRRPVTSLPRRRGAGRSPGRCTWTANALGAWVSNRDILG